MPQITSLLQPIIEHRALIAAGEALSPVAAGGTGPRISGLTRPAKAVAAAILAHRLKRPVIFVTSDNETADNLAETSATVFTWLEGAGAQERVGVLPAFDCTPYEGRSPHAEIMERRAVTLWNLGCRRLSMVFAPVQSTLLRYQDLSFYSSLAVEVKVGDELLLEALVEHLASVGYEAGEPVNNVGQFSVRGGILDVYSAESALPFRIEFFGDQVDSLREFDPDSQRSKKSVNSALLLPLVEFSRGPHFFEDLTRKLAARSPVLRPGQPDWQPEYSAPFPGWEFFVPLVHPHSRTLFSLMERPVLIWDEPLDRERQLRKVQGQVAAAYDEIRDIVPPRPTPEELFLTEEEFVKAVRLLNAAGMKELGSGFESPLTPDETDSAFFPPAEGDSSPESPFPTDVPLTYDDIGVELEELQPAPSGAQETEASLPEILCAGPEVALATQPAPKFHLGVKQLAEALRSGVQAGQRIGFILPTAGKAERLREILEEYEIPFATFGGDIPKAGTPEEAFAPAVYLASGALEEGVSFPEAQILLLSDKDLFGSFDWGARGHKKRSGISTFISDLSDLKVGDYVVHLDHGIALYQGLRQIEVEGKQRDFMLLTFQDDARLYVPLERLDLVEKYRRSGEGAKPVLDRLGGGTWERTKTRVKKALKDMAQELLRLYAERKMHGGTAAGADSPWQKELEDSFEYEETPDQLTALCEIKKDLESPEPMDRLLCGDVGYGKTEIAMRAAFKVAQDGRQVAVLAPTTVLALQHFKTFKRRMAAFPLRIEMLSRFRSPAEQKQVLGDLEASRVDIIIGTHRLLSKDVKVRDLGLLVVDEEQRFGVAAKEKLKRFRANVDVLTMSATPIPRTLHMSLGGLRDLSVIETPPQGRLSIHTTVAPFAQGLIQTAILHELERQGQVFFVHNRVESIFSMAALVQRLVPTARIGVAHGQMSEHELERVMLKLMQGDYDVLVSTSLIENGLDIPRANTIIVNRADRFGLSELYQLRGRVGRANRRAYAFFLIPSEDTLTPIARKRLAALKEFSDLGAGFRLAALDLELRGAGNLLGAEQHGHLNAIGIDLYLKMLEETVEELKGATPKLAVRTTLNLGLDIKIPDAYIADESQRLRMYKRISNLQTEEERQQLAEELQDRFGQIPESVAHLLEYALLKSAAEKLLVQSIEKKGDEFWIRFHEQSPTDAKKLTHLIRRFRDASFRPDGVLRFRLPRQSSGVVESLRNVLQELQG